MAGVGSGEVVVEGLPEDQGEARAGGPEPVVGPEGEVDLQDIGTEEDPVERVAPADVEVIDGEVMAIHLLGPGGDDRVSIDSGAEA